MQQLITDLEQPLVLPLLKEKPDSDLASVLRALSTTRRYVTCLSDDKDEVDAAGSDLRLGMSESDVEAVLEAMGRNRKRCCGRVSKISIGRASSEASVQAVLVRIEAGWFPSLRWLEVVGEERGGTGAAGEALGRVLEQGGLETLIAKGDHHLGEAVVERIGRLGGLRTLRVRVEYPGLGVECRGRLIAGLAEVAMGLEALELGIGMNEIDSGALSKVLPQLDGLRELDLGAGFILQTPCGAMIGQLPLLTKLERLRLEGISIGDNEGTDSLCDGLRGLTRLKDLNLRDCYLISSDLVAIMGALKGAAGLETLNFVKNYAIDLDEDEAKAVVEAMGHWPRLRSLDVAAINDESFSIIEGLASLRRVERLKLFHVRLGTEGSTLLAAYLEKNVTLKEILLNACSISPEGMEAIGRQIGHLGQLEMLNISFDHEVGSCEALAESLRSLHNLRKLDFSYSSVEGTTRIIRELWRVPSLTFLYLEVTTSEQLMLLSEQLWALTSLRVLKLNSSEHVNEAEPLVRKLHLLLRLETLAFTGVVLEGCVELFAQQLKHLDRLTELTLGRAALDSDDALAIADACGELRQLRKLDLDDGGIDNATKLVLLRRCLARGPLSHLVHFDIHTQGLLGAGFIWNEGSFVRRHPLFFAAGSGDLELVRELLAGKASVDETEIRNGDSVLHFAARAGRDEAIRVLVQEGGASLGIKNMAGESVVDVSAEGSTTRALLEEMVYVGADEQPGKMTKSAAKRFKPMDRK